MDGAFDPSNLEADLYAKWESEGHFAPTGNGTPYSIMIPPPNITGSLHMGHAFQHTIMDALIRVHRMRGDATLWQMGTDHAGIATQLVVEAQLARDDITRTDLGRDAFVDKVWEWRNTSGGEISKQLRRMGSSLDWSRDRFTMDEGFSAAVTEVFVRLFEDDLIYRGRRLVNWDPSLKTAISDLEVDNVEEQGSIWEIRYPLADGATTAAGDDFVVVATTRPETMLGDTAVAVHPEDERYADLVGKAVVLPLTERRVPIVADDYVDREFGTGCLKITPAHDFNDYEVGERHGLPAINIFEVDGSINDQAPAAYVGLDRADARRAVCADLDELGLLASEQPHTLSVPRGEKSGAIIEPFLTDQWFVKMEPLAAPAIKAVEDGDIQFVPKQYENLYFAWMRDIRDWCISRQLWWGHQIPAWYDDDGAIYVARTEAEARAKYNLAAELTLRRDPDVLETWFSSALWTFGTLGWPEQTPELARFHPTDALVTGHDIIFFWVARMIMMTLRFMDEIPFKTVYIHGLVNDADGRKMSKSKGNGLDPLDLLDGISLEDLVAKRTANLLQDSTAKSIEKATRRDFPDGIPSYGTDALRFTFCAMASTGRDIRFELNRIAGYRNFCNKLWNAARFVYSNTETLNPNAPATPSLPDRWIRSRLQRLISDVERAIDTYRFDLYANLVYDFIWHEYCDWYLEMSKPLMWQEHDSPERTAAQRTLLDVLETVLRIAHPIMPFITEALWQTARGRLGLPEGTIMLQPFPLADATQIDATDEAEAEWVKGVVAALRNIRGEQDIAPSKAIPALLQDGDSDDARRHAAHGELVTQLARLSEFTWLETDVEAPAAATGLVGGMKVLVPLAGLIDVDAERARLTKEIARKEKEVVGTQKKLDNESFVAKAPPAVVDKERAKLADASRALAMLGQQMRDLDAL